MASNDRYTTLTGGAAESLTGGSFATRLVDVSAAWSIELEREALVYGDQTLVDDIRQEAAAWVDELHPWDGRGDEPPERVSAYLAVWWQRIDQERAARVGTLVRRGGKWTMVGPARCPVGHPLGPRRVLIGWSPCRCRGHHTWTCQVELPSGRLCGTTVLHPEPGERCRPVGIG